jgi:hypothetical protein
MNDLIQIIKEYSNKVLLDEDGERLSIEIVEGAHSRELQEFEDSYRITLPKELKELLLFSNGIKIFGIQIYSLSECQLFENNMLLSFHDWGNGDFDCISVDSGLYYGKVYFINHSIANSIAMNISFSEWVFQAIKEIQDKGTILHPMDYLTRKEEGMYREVFLKLKTK